MTVTHATKVDRGSETGTFDSATEETNTYLTAYYVATIAIIKMFPHCVVQLFRNREYVGYRSHGNNLWCKHIGTHGFHIIFITKILYYLLNYKTLQFGEHHMLPNWVQSKGFPSEEARQVVNLIAYEPESTTSLMFFRWTMANACCQNPSTCRKPLYLTKSQ